VGGKGDRPTLATVAASAGVSVATVSKVVNGRSDVSPATRALVEHLLAQHDYVGRRGEAVQRPTVELVFYNDLNAYYTEVVQGVVRAAGEEDVAVVLSSRSTAATAEQSAASWARELAAATRRAVIVVTSELTATEVAALARARLPLVVVDPNNLPRTRVMSVGSTNFAGGLAATQHLIGLGHERIAYLGGPARTTSNQARVHGFRGAMEAAGLPVRDEYVQYRQFRYEEGVAGGATLLDLRESPTAVFAANDEIALGVIEAARVRGVRVPEDLSVVGFDDTQLAALGSPPLTTVRQPLREMGAVALRRALRLAAGEEIESHHIELATELVVRGSTAAPGRRVLPRRAPEGDGAASAGFSGVPV